MSKSQKNNLSKNREPDFFVAPLFLNFTLEWKLMSGN